LVSSVNIGGGGMEEVCDISADVVEVVGVAVSLTVGFGV
jgi:hypothetical protein